MQFSDIFKKFNNRLKMKQHNQYLKNKEKYPNHMKTCKQCQRSLTR
ncbi:hypothetical protein LT335_00254 [Spiroplasma sp. JKS002669]|nr:MULTISPECIES: hypothetical protein [unclassified Spiroplasma]MCL6428707.1 hypothetical protein [Spiroplasma sp. JKS002669]MCL8211031.1 hypothetical protein [Spiroplasma sp. JKS002671]